MLDEVVPVTFRLVGALGGVVSVLGVVVTTAWLLPIDTLPAPSRASSDSRYVVFGVNPVTVYEVAVVVDVVADHADVVGGRGPGERDRGRADAAGVHVARRGRWLGVGAPVD